MALYKYLSKKEGPGTSPSAESGGFIRTRDGLAAPEYLDLAANKRGSRVVPCDRQGTDSPQSLRQTGEHVFRLYQARARGAYDLFAENAEYPTITVNARFPAEIMGVCVEHRKKRRRESHTR